MANKLGFYIHQGLKYAGQSKLTILVLGLAVSMIAGFGYYYDSAQYFTLHDSFTNIVDFGVDFEEYGENNFNTILNEEAYGIKNNFKSSTLDIQNFFYYQSVISDYVKLQFYNLHNISIKERPLWILSNSSLFETSRFSDYFKIENGTFPRNPNEFMVSQSFAHNHNISVGINQTLNVELGKGFVTTNKIRCNIVGIYSTLHLDNEFGESDIYPDMAKIFGYINFKNPDFNNTFGNYINLLKILTETKTIPDFGFKTKRSLGIFYNRESINTAMLSLNSLQIKQKITKISIHLPNNYNVYNILSKVLDAQYNFQTDLRLKIQITNIPLFIFAIYLGSIATKSKIKGRYHEFFSMRMRGFKNSMIRSQFIFEALINSLLISITGLLFGLGIFKFGQYWLNSISLPDYNTTNFSLSFHMTYETIIETIIFSTIITLLATISSIRHVNSLKTSELVEALNKQGEDLDYDETTLFIEKYKEELEIDKEEDLLNIKDFIEKKENKIPKWGLPVASLALIPIFLYVLILYQQSFIVPDILVDLSESLQNHFEILILFAMISPFIIVVGFLHFLLVESKLRLANLAKKISHIFVKKRDYFVGIEMVRQKQHSRIIILTSIFLSLMLFTNITLNSYLREQNILDNFKVGTDMKYSFSITKNIFNNVSELDDFEHELNRINDSSNNFLINDHTRVYESEDFKIRFSNFRYFVNFSEYSQIINSNDKKLPSKHLLEDISEVISFNKDLDDKTVGVIVSSTYLDNNALTIGSTFNITHDSSINFTSGIKIPAKVVKAKILKVIDVMPGLYLAKDEDNGFIAIDNHIFNYSKDIFPTTKVTELINFNHSNKERSHIQVENLIKSSISYPIFGETYKFYNYNWNSIDAGSFNSLEFPYIGIFYFDLIIIGIILTMGITILIYSANDENKKMYGELMVRGFGKKGIYSLITVEVIVSFIISIFVGFLSGLFTSFIFCKFLIQMSVGEFINLPIFFDYIEFLEILGLIIGLTFIFLAFAFIKYSQQYISEFLKI
ncbi:MAG: FtsX-like permease family protein [Promethearchaeota archaeon]